MLNLTLFLTYLIKLFKGNMVSIQRCKETFVDYTVAIATSKPVKEIISLVAVGVFLHYTSNWLCRGQPLLSTDRIWYMVVLAPVLEEYIFRGAMQRGIMILQGGADYFRNSNKKEFAEDITRKQQVYRIHFTAAVFGLAHLSNGYTMIQCFSCYFVGVGWGYLSEKYSSLALPILLHGIHNALVAYLTGHLLKAPLTTTTLALAMLTLANFHTLRISSYLIGTDRIKLLNPREFTNKIQPKLTFIAARIGLIKESKMIPVGHLVYS